LRERSDVPKSAGEGDQLRMSIIEHLDELRRRLIVCAAALSAAFLVAFIGKNWIFGLLEKPLKSVQGSSAALVTFSPTEPFMTIVKVSGVAALLLAVPVVLYELWAFLMPALYESERRSILPYVFFTVALFVGGVAFGYFLVLPVGLRVLLNYGDNLFNQQLRASEYIDFVSLFLLGFGLVFELPVIILVLNALGIVNQQRLRKGRRYAVLIVAVLAMVITPTQDPINMIITMVPLMLLYEFGILLTRLAEKRRVKRQRQEVLTRTG
jgi:sec-independent protein translocase protein TatC